MHTTYIDFGLYTTQTIQYPPIPKSQTVSIPPNPKIPNCSKNPEINQTVPLLPAQKILTNFFFSVDSAYIVSNSLMFT